MSLSLPARPAVPESAVPDSAVPDLAVPDFAGEAPTDRLPRVTVQPVFVDATGRRMRRLRRTGALVGVACVGYLVVLAVAVGAGVVDPVTSGFPLSDAVAPLVADPATTTTTSRATTRSATTTTRTGPPGHRRRRPRGERPDHDRGHRPHDGRPDDDQRADDHHERTGDDKRARDGGHRHADAGDQRRGHRPRRRRRRWRRCRQSRWGRGVVTRPTSPPTCAAHPAGSSAFSPRSSSAPCSP